MRIMLTCIKNINIFILIIWSLFFFFFISPSLYCEIKKKGFTYWLKDYYALDMLEKELASKSSSFKTILQRAELLIQLNQPDKAIELLDTLTNFKDPDKEAYKIFLKAKAFRLKSDITNSVLCFVHAGSLSNNLLMNKIVKEPHLDMIWRVFFIKSLWKNAGNINQGQVLFLNKVIRMAMKLWPSDNFWKYAYSFIEKLRNYNYEHIKIDHNISKILASLAIRNYNLAAYFVNQLNSKEKVLWSTIINIFLNSYESPTTNLSYLTPNEKKFLSYPKISAFLDIFHYITEITALDKWVVKEPEDIRFKKFKQIIYSNSILNGYKLLNKELSSVFVDPKIKPTLKLYLFVYSILNNDFEKAEKMLSHSDIDPKELPLFILLCGLNENFLRSNLTLSSQVKNNIILAFSSLLKLPSPINLDLWDNTVKSNKPKEYTFDFLLLYNQCSNMQNPRYCSLLFPSLPVGLRALLNLARASCDKNNLTLAHQYIGVIYKNIIPGKNEFYVKYLKILAKIKKMENMFDEAFDLYLKIFNLHPSALSFKDILKAALLGQQLGKWKDAQQMLMFLYRKYQKDTKISDRLKAEVMFWIADGFQNLKENDKALTFYLRLAWEYPNQHIWYITAMYRAALIYERKQQYITAKKLLEKVMKEADKKSQKRAALARLKAIQKKIITTTPYPF